MVELEGTNKTRQDKTDRQTAGVEILSPFGVCAVQLAMLQCVATDRNCLTAHDWAAAVCVCSASNVAVRGHGLELPHRS